MTNQQLKQKTGRYIQNESCRSEINQVQNWLSCTNQKLKGITIEERKLIEQEILFDIQCYTAYPLFFPKPKPWWKKIFY